MTKEIPLTKGKVALVDDEDYDFLMQWKWAFNGFYAKRTSIVLEKDTTVYMHRVVKVAPQKVMIDHINGNKLDNRKENLRLCGPLGNSMNKSFTGNASGYKGVRVVSKNNKIRYRASIKVCGREVSLGTYITPDAAARAYDEGAKKHHGIFANVNFKDGSQ